MAAPAPFVWITGAGGLIGHHLTHCAPRFAPDWQGRGLTRDQLDLLDARAVRQAFAKEQPGAVIHCAALTSNPACQANPDLAYRTNVETTALLAELAADIPFVFFSTDLVFDGRLGNYDELSPVNPLSVYAETKVKAEQIVLQNPLHTVIRTSLNAGVSPDGARAFNEQMRHAWEQGKSLKLFVDEFRCPIPVEATVRATWDLMSREATGLFHVAGAERLSRWEIGNLVASRYPQLNPVIIAASTRDYTVTSRPPDTSLNCTRARKLLSFPLPGFGAWLAAHPEETI